MFKSATIYQLTQATTAVLTRLQKALPLHAFAPCLPKQARSAGWVPPLGAGELAYQTNGAVLFCLRTDLKEVPASNIKHTIQAMVAQAADTVEPMSPVDIRVAKEELIEQALPHTLAKISTRYAYIDTKLHLLLIEGGELDADEFMLSLKKTLDGTPFKLLGVNNEPCDLFTDWMKDPDKLGDALSLGDSCSLKHAKEGGTSIINVRHDDLESNEMSVMLDAGKQCCRIALVHDDVNFAVTAKLGLRQVIVPDAEDLSDDDEELTTPGTFAVVVDAYRTILEHIEPLLGGFPKQELLDLSDEQQQEQHP